MALTIVQASQRKKERERKRERVFWGDFAMKTVKVVIN